MEPHELYMRRCFELAELGSGHVAPNPLVGCILVRDGDIVGEGWHKHFGGPHAEVHALADAVSRHGEDVLHTSTLYVNLEPCSHFGKTPPCADLLISRGIRKVMISNTDPFESVQGNGIRRMRDAGIEVVTGILDTEGAFLNRRFFTFHLQKRPYIVLKFARSADNFIAPETTSSGIHWISGPLSRKLVHKWRTEESAIMVGSATALHDNPHLTARDWPGKSPLRIVVDREGKLPARLHLFDQQVPTVVFTATTRTGGHNLEFVQLKPDEHFIQNIFKELHRRNILSVMVEGGRRLIDLLSAESLWDEARIFTSPVPLERGIAAPALVGKVIRQETIGSDSLTWMMRK